MTLATDILAADVAAMPAAAPSRALRKPASIIIASINRDEGDTGVHTHTRMLSAGMRDAGVKCEVISPFSGSHKWLPIFAVRPLLLKKINRTWSTLWHRHFHAAALRENLKNRLCRGGVDAILAQCPVSAQAALDVRTALGRSTPVIMVCHFNHSEATEYRDKGELANQRSYEAMLAFEAGVLEAVDRVIYVSNWARGSVEVERKLATRSSAVIWNGVNTVSQSPLSRGDIGVTETDLILMNVGSIEPRKNQLGLIDLFAVLHEQSKNAKLVLIGDGPQRAEVERKTGQLGLGNAVKFLGHRRDVPALLPLADLYLHYAKLENCPLVLLEAARAGVPIAAVPTGGVPELQHALDCKFDIDPGDLRGSLKRLQPLLSSRDLRHEHGGRAREAFIRTFTQEAMAQAYVNALSFPQN